MALPQATLLLRRIMNMLGAPVHASQGDRSLQDYFEGVLPGVILEEDGPLIRIRLPGGANRDRPSLRQSPGGPGNPVPLFARPEPSTDLTVFEQIFVQEEYQPAVDYFQLNHPGLGPLRIIDGGANVGYTARFLLAAFPGSSVACVEPDADNADLLERNLAPWIARGEVSVHRKGVLGEHGIPLTTSRDFRGGGDWAITVEPTEEATALTSTTVDRLMADLSWDRIDFLKLDIEGAERFVFSPGSSLDFLDRTQLMMIEIHDDSGRDDIIHLLREREMLLLQVGESTLAVQTRSIDAGP